MADWYFGSVQHAAVAQFAVSTAYTVGQLIRQLAAPASGNERVFRCTTAGNTAAAEPAWNLGAGATTTSGTATFTEVTGNSTYGWAAAAARHALALTRAAAGDRMFMAHDHNEANAAGATLAGNGSAANPVKVICVNAAGSVPPVAADVQTSPTGTINSAASTNITFNNNKAAYYGVFFNAGLVTVLNNTDLDYKFFSCKMKGIGTNNAIQIGSTSARSKIEMVNHQFDFDTTARVIQILGGEVLLRDSPNPLPGTIPTNLFDFTSVVRGAFLTCDGVDFSAAGAGKTIISTLNAAPSKVNFRNCKFHASATVVGGTIGRGAEVNLFYCEGTPILRVTIEGTKSKETTIVRTGGADDSDVASSWKIVTTASNNDTFPFECWPVTIWNDAIGGPVTYAFELVNDGVTLTNAEVWVDAEYLDTTASRLSQDATSAPSTPLTAAVNLTASTETWTTTGLASPIKQKASVTITPNEVGFVRLTLKVARKSVTLYVDPKVA